MKLIEVRLGENVDPQKESRTIVIVEFEEYELMELKNEAGSQIEKGVNLGTARILMERYDDLAKIIRAVREFKSTKS